MGENGSGKVLKATLKVEQISPREVRMKVIPDALLPVKESERRQVFPLLDGYLTFDSSILPAGFDRANPSVNLSLVINVANVPVPEPAAETENKTDAQPPAPETPQAPEPPAPPEEVPPEVSVAPEVAPAPETPQE